MMWKLHPRHDTRHLESSSLRHVQRHHPSIRSATIDLSAVASAKVEAEARETDKALKEILEKLGV
jgi:hypothetical protein